MWYIIKYSIINNDAFAASWFLNVFKMYLKDNHKYLILISWN